MLDVCIKKKSDDAMEALHKHRGMLLKPEHFVAMRINWGDKSQNLREIAAELNIDIDSLAFVDDNPIERQQIRTQVPEVFVIELPSDAMEFARAIRECPRFERLSLSTEDQRRSEYYQKQRERGRFEETV